MYIQNTEALRSWLEACLGKISNAEPAALAKYVVALVKKDKEEDELYSFLMDQLEIFLHKNTKFFVDLLFDVLSSKSYSNFSSEESMKSSVNELLQKGTPFNQKTDVNDSQASPVPIENLLNKPIKKERLDSDHSPTAKEKDDLSKQFPGEKRESTLFNSNIPRKKPKYDCSLLTNKDKKTERENPFVSKRCKDYDEKGFCMKGNSCIYDHGSDPVVVDFNVNADRDSLYREDHTLPQEISSVAPPLPPMPPPPTSPPPLPPIPPPSFLFSPEAYNPEAPGINAPSPVYDYQSTYYLPNPSGIPTHVPVRSSIPHQPNHLNSKPKVVRELVIPSANTIVPITKNFIPRDAVNRSNVQRDNFSTDQDFKNKRREPIYSRLGLSNPKKNEPRCTLLLLKVPLHLNTIQSINEHFSKFGTVENIEVHYGGDPEAALVRFANSAEATAAHRSTEAVMNNRFIKVFYHNNKSEPVKKNDISTNNSSSGSRSEILNAHFASKNAVQNPPKKTYADKVPEIKKAVNYSSRGLVRTVFNHASFALKNKAPDVTSKVPKEDKKDALQKQIMYHKEFQNVLSSQIDLQKLVLAKLKTSKTQKDKDALKKVLEGLGKSINDLASHCKKRSQELVTLLNERKLSKTDTEKALLDAEIDLYKQQNSLGPNDTASLLAKVNELRQKAKAMGLLETPKLYPCEKKKFSSELLKIDNRPRTIIVTGVNDREAVKTHFMQFGDIEGVESKNGSYAVTFTSRKGAEMAFLNGKQLKDTLLTISWLEKSQGNSGENSAGNVDEEKDDNLNLVDEDEDEEDSESRSWRR